jgi:hypothetical protein
MATHMDIDIIGQSAFAQLPNDLWQNIIKYVSAHDVCQVAQTCRALCWLSKDNAIWRR